MLQGLDTTFVTETMKGLQTKRVAGIEPASIAWKAIVLPLNYTRILSGLDLPLKHISISLTLCKQRRSRDWRLTPPAENGGIVGSSILKMTIQTA
jgi:hypothetical protein